jgi:hypothetical protein
VQLDEQLVDRIVFFTTGCLCGYEGSELPARSWLDEREQSDRLVKALAVLSSKQRYLGMQYKDVRRQRQQM